MSHPKPLLTVGIPFFDEERRLAEAVRSILRQSVADFELLLVDDGSTDASLAIARGFDDPRVRVLSDGRHRGLPARLNQIVREAKADRVARMDADDLAHPARFERTLAALEHGPARVAGTWVGLVDERGRAFAVVENGPLPPTPRSALESGVLPHATMIAPRDWLLDHPYDESLSSAEDRDLWCRVVHDRDASTLFTVVREPLYLVVVEAADPRFAERYVEAHRTYRALLRRHGRASVGAARSLGLTGMSLVKATAMKMAAWTGKVDALVGRRGRSPTPAETRTIDEALRSAS